MKNQNEDGMTTMLNYVSENFGFENILAKKIEVCSECQTETNRKNTSWNNGNPYCQKCYKEVER